MGGGLGVGLTVTSSPPSTPEKSVGSSSTSSMSNLLREGLARGELGEGGGACGRRRMQTTLLGMGRFLLLCTVVKPSSALAAVCLGALAALAARATSVVTVTGTA